MSLWLRQISQKECKIVFDTNSPHHKLKIDPIIYSRSGNACVRLRLIVIIVSVKNFKRLWQERQRQRRTPSRLHCRRRRHWRPTAPSQTTRRYLFDVNWNPGNSNSEWHFSSLRQKMVKLFRPKITILHSKRAHHRAHHRKTNLEDREKKLLKNIEFFFTRSLQESKRETPLTAREVNSWKATEKAETNSIWSVVCESILLSSIQPYKCSSRLEGVSRTADRCCELVERVLSATHMYVCIWCM